MIQGPAGEGRALKQGLVDTGSTGGVMLPVDCCIRPGCASEGWTYVLRGEAPAVGVPARSWSTAAGPNPVSPKITA